MCRFPNLFVCAVIGYRLTVGTRSRMNTLKKNRQMREDKADYGTVTAEKYDKRQHFHLVAGIQVALIFLD